MTHLGQNVRVRIPRFEIGHTRARDVAEHRELRRHFMRQFGFGAGLVTRRHGTWWVSARWGAAR